MFESLEHTFPSCITIVEIFNNTFPVTKTLFEVFAAFLFTLKFEEANTLMVVAFNFSA